MLLPCHKSSHFHVNFFKVVSLRQEETGTTENDISLDVIGWHHQLDGHKFEQALGVGDGQESQVCCSPWGHKESDTTE